MQSITKAVQGVMLVAADREDPTLPLTMSGDQHSCEAILTLCAALESVLRHGLQGGTWLRDDGPACVRAAFTPKQRRESIAIRILAVCGISLAMFSGYGRCAYAFAWRTMRTGSITILMLPAVERNN